MILARVNPSQVVDEFFRTGLNPVCFRSDDLEARVSGESSVMSSGGILGSVFAFVLVMGSVEGSARKLRSHDRDPWHACSKHGKVCDVEGLASKS